MGVGMNKTKTKIILQAIQLYNELGFSSVTNQQIAKASGVSLSNFNYHFATKQDLVHAIFEYMANILVDEVYGQNSLIDTGNGWEITKRYFVYEQQFKFFYLETPIIIRTYPELQDKLRKQFDDSIQLIKNLSYLAIGKGLMKPEPEDMPGLYHRLAEQIWMSNHFWIAQSFMRGTDEDVVNKGLSAAMSIIYPYLTEKGKASYAETLESMVTTTP